MGAKDWMLFYADGDIRSVLRAAPPLDRPATQALVERLYPSQRLSQTGDGCLDAANPPDGQVYAACFEGLTVLCTSEVALDRPSQLAKRFLAEGKGRTTYLHAMHSVVDWFAYGIWAPDGALERSLSLSPDNGIIENIGAPLPFEAPYWAGERRVMTRTKTNEDPFPLPFIRSSSPRTRCAHCSASTTKASITTTTPTSRPSCWPATGSAHDSQPSTASDAPVVEGHVARRRRAVGEGIAQQHGTGLRGHGWLSEREVGRNGAVREDRLPAAEHDREHP